MNTSPDDRRRCLTQSEHESWNAENYPGTRQLCNACDIPIGRCEEDSIFDADGNPICEACNENREES